MRSILCTLVLLVVVDARIEVLAVELDTDFSQVLQVGSSEIPGESGSSNITALASGDFDCDGVTDLAVGSGFSTANGVASAGSLAIGFGNTLLGVRAGGQRLHQSSVDVNGAAESDDDFGTSLAAADFDGDGCSDLAVGIPGEDVGSPSINNAGGVAVFLGRVGGPTGADDRFLPPGETDAPHGPSDSHRKGTALAAIRRFTSASSQPMLAIGSIGHSSGAALGAGGISVRRSGSTDGDLAVPVTFIERNQIFGELGRASDLLGRTLASGDFDGDGFGDLAAMGNHVGGCAVTVPNSLCLENNGYVLVGYGATNVSGIELERIHQDTAGIPGANQVDDLFGVAMAVGDFDGDGFDDLAVGVPGKRVNGVDEAGAVVVLFGGSGGLLANAQRSVQLTQSSLSGLVLGEGDEFGAALAAGDFDADGVDDLVVGIPGKRLGSALRAGLVAMIPSAVFASAPVVQARLFQLPSPSTQDRYGNVLDVGDLNDDGVDDLAVAAPGRRSGSGVQKGAVHMLYGSSETNVSIFSIEPPTVTPGQTYRVRVVVRRTPDVGTPRIRGTVQVRASDGSECVASLSTSSGLGNCTMVAPGIGTVVVSAEYSGLVGFRASVAPTKNLTVAIDSPYVFSDGFDNE